MARPFEVGDIVVSYNNTYTVTQVLSDDIYATNKYGTATWIKQCHIGCIRTPRKGSKEARDIVAMLGKQARIAKNLQARELGWKFLKEFYRNGGIKNYGVVIFESAKSMLK